MLFILMFALNLYQRKGRDIITLLFINNLNNIIMRVSKFTSKETLIDYIKDNLHLKSVEVSKLYEGNEITVDTNVLFQIRTKSRITLQDLGIIGILHKDVSICTKDDELLLTWSE